MTAWRKQKPKLETEDWNQRVRKQGTDHAYHRHEALSVKAPPRRGPTTLEMPNIDDNIAIYNGLLIKGTENPT